MNNPNMHWNITVVLMAFTRPRYGSERIFPGLTFNNQLLFVDISIKK